MAASGAKGKSRDAAARRRRQKDKEERSSLVLYRRPFVTLRYFLLETLTNLKEWMSKLSARRGTVLSFLGVCSVVSITFYVAYHTEGAHQTHVHHLTKRFQWCAYWVILGIMSSCGLGTGVHTFLLYLCPHIINVTLAAYECGSTDFPEPPYPEHVICPQIAGTESVSVWSIMSKVRLEACMWGVGTAIGELPPYFMARAARLSGTDPEVEDYEEFEDMLEQAESAKGCVPRAKLWVKDMVQRLGFFGILAFASIPNPFFDLAGMTCGHYLVPFWTFFGATLIGKVVVKMHIQKLFVIMVFSKHIVEQLLSLIGSVPRIGPSLQKPLHEYLEAQKKKLRNDGSTEAADGYWLQWVFGWVLLVTIFLLVCSIINSMAQTYAKRLQQQKQSKEKKKIKTKSN